MRISLLYIMVILGMIGCSKDGEVPAYLKLNDFELSTSPGEGTSADKVTDAWVYVNGQEVGAFELPAEVPVIAEGPTDIVIWGGVKENGVLSHSVIYPFYNRIVKNINLVPTETTTIDLESTYQDVTEFAIVEDFEGGHFFNDDLDGDRDTKIQITSKDVFEGSNSGLIELDSAHPILEAGWDELFFPQQAELAWVELNYKTNIPFIIGIRGSKDGQPVSDYTTFINTKNEWNKIYFNFSSLVESAVFDVAQMVIVAAWTEELDLDKAEIRIDNFKLVRKP